ncbi:hypothetical protein [Alteromonas halophila]|uniref:Porin family protein n=1 Tax=Alteromonas halophila TaxID=516698 RepID=A0A918JHK0_9ALTE|nr:hypothetical protein [Alteromonas halophila]GGW81194.1 hypothetical protein GCM10007391_12920 [Alteromonas halophila]
MNNRRSPLAGVLWVTITLWCPVSLASQKNIAASNTYPEVIYQSAPESVSFKSKKVPAWTVYVEQTPSSIVPLPTRLLPDNQYQVQSLRVSASRALPSTFPQHLFASFRASPYNSNDYLDWLLIPSEAGMAATIGWRIGDPRRLNFAVEVEHRELGQDTNITSLLLGVHYFF